MTGRRSWVGFDIATKRTKSELEVRASKAGLCGRSGANEGEQGQWCGAIHAIDCGQRGGNAAKLLHVPVSGCCAELRLHSAYGAFHFTLTRMRATFVAPQSVCKLSDGLRVCGRCDELPLSTLPENACTSSLCCVVLALRGRRRLYAVTYAPLVSACFFTTSVSAYMYSSYLPR